MKRILFSKMTMAALTMLLLFSMAACSKVTKENYDKIKVGMAYSEVVDIIGEPKACNSLLNTKDCTWGDETKSINAKIIADKVVFLSAKGL